MENNHLDTKCYQCPADRAPFPSWSALEDHYNTHHLTNPQHRCDYAGCDKVYGNRQTLKTHQRIHKAREERVLKCTFKANGHFEFTKQVELDLHMKKHSSVPCFYCDRHDDCVEKNKSFSKKVDLKQHIISRMIDQKEAQRVRCI